MSKIYNINNTPVTDTGQTKKMGKLQFNHMESVVLTLHRVLEECVFVESMRGRMPFPLICERRRFELEHSTDFHWIEGGHQWSISVRITCVGNEYISLIKCYRDGWETSKSDVEDSYGRMLQELIYQYDRRGLLDKQTPHTDFISTPINERRLHHYEKSKSNSPEDR